MAQCTRAEASGGISEFAEACKIGDVDMCASMIAALDDRSTCNALLVVAARHGCTRVVELLLDEVEQKKRISEPAAFISSVDGGGSGDCSSVGGGGGGGGGGSRESGDGGASALGAAALRGHDGVVRLLIARGADVNHRSSDGSTALLWSCFNGHRTTTVSRRLGRLGL